VRVLASALRALPPETLDAWTREGDPVEGWILGLDHAETLRNAARKALSEAPAAPPLRNDCFALPPGVDWTPVDQALATLRDRLHPVAPVETCGIEAAVGRVVARDVIAQASNPPAANTAVDGYAFAGGRGEGLHRLPLVEGRAAAGDAPGVVPEGHAIRALTGAALPGGTDTVVLQEDTVVSQGAVVFHGPLKTGANARRAGEDVEAGECVLEAGRRIGAAEAALLAATGVREVAVYEPLRVAVVSTGDELVPAGSTAAPGRIFDANRPMLLKMIADFGHIPVDMGQVPDKRDALRARLDAAAAQADAILTSGGASAGDEDHVSALLSEAGAMTLWRVAMKPGRPLALGLWQGAPVFGLPGNPVAAMVCTLIFAAPALARLGGAGWFEPQGFEVPAAFSKRKKPGRSEYLRARVRDGRVEVFRSEGSGRVSGLAWADGLVVLPHEACTIEPGDPVRYVPFTSFGLRT
jgi:molybdopterin molybdotransferase